MPFLSSSISRALQLQPVAARCSIARPRVLSSLREVVLATPDSRGTSMNSKANAGAGVDRVQELVHGGTIDGWEKCWEQGVTPWDLGKPTPILKRLHQIGALPKGRTLVPGCGTGYDVAAIACPERFVVGLDISEVAIRNAVEVCSSLSNADYYTFLKEDFFTWQPAELFDLIFDYTFFCAIYPEMRPLWGQRIAELLKPDGELITLMFPISDHVGGPPYKVSTADYEAVLVPMGFKALSVVDNDLAVGPRKGREKLGRWKRMLTQPAL